MSRMTNPPSLHVMKRVVGTYTRKTDFFHGDCWMGGEAERDGDSRVGLHDARLSDPMTLGPCTMKYVADEYPSLPWRIKTKLNRFRDIKTCWAIESKVWILPPRQVVLRMARLQIGWARHSDCFHASFCMSHSVSVSHKSSRMNIDGYENRTPAGFRMHKAPVVSAAHAEETKFPRNIVRSWCRLDQRCFFRKLW